ncbi:MAG: hypothetical protein L6435_05555 [Anaerolineae bacterium]|nr:hypothetical protein [Anaerolineae bacterium]
MSNNRDPGPPLNTFIVRFWRETGAGEGRWRGQVQHVQSGERIAFADKGTLMSFIGRWVQMRGEHERLS